jgi:predicted transcriptional regulator
MKTLSYNKPRATKSRTGVGKDAAGATAASWTFLTNHAHTLILLAAEADLPLREVAARVGITERAVQRIVAELEAAGILARARVGRNNRYAVNFSAPLRHPIESHRTVGDLVRMAKQ